MTSPNSNASPVLNLSPTDDPSVLPTEEHGHSEDNDSESETNSTSDDEGGNPSNTLPLTEHTFSFATLLQNYIQDGTVCGRAFVDSISEVLYGERLGSSPSGHLSEYDATIGMLHQAHAERQDNLTQIKCLLKVLQDGHSHLPIADIVILLLSDPEWPAISIEPASAWSLLWQALGFPLSMPIRSPTISGQIKHIFPIVPIKAYKNLEVNLEDIRSVGIIIQPSSRVHEHLELKGDKLSVYCLGEYNTSFLHQYEKNKAARLLGIENLGKEILSSLYILYDEERLYEDAKTLSLLNFKTGVPSMLMSIYNDPIRWHVLASRISILQNEVKYRRSWLPSLLRDIKLQSESQPMIFWGSLLAIFVGLCTFIQTVVSVWALVLAIKSQ